MPVPLDFAPAIERDLAASVARVADALKVELVMQGHRATGRLERSVRPVRLGPGYFGVEALGYLRALDEGVPAGEVRRVARDRAARLKLVAALAKWWRQRRGGNASARMARSVAIRILRVAMRTGFPTPGAYRHARNGRRTGAIAAAVAAAGDLPNRFPSFERELGTFLADPR